MLFADLHLHSPYARGTSDKMIPSIMTKYGKMKGLHVLATGDCTFKRWLDEIKPQLSDLNNGLFDHKGMKFMLTGEISCIYKKGDKVRKIHHIITVPSFDSAYQIIDVLGKRGNLISDGRPILGIKSPELVEILKSIDKNIQIIPAHIWTPWFSLFGSKSGFDTVEDCYEDMTKHIFALETGLSSDPEMNWRLSQLDKYTLISNSDSHSPYPWRIGRECNVFDIDDPTYDNIIQAIRTKEKFLFTIETEPAYGKYHYDGHRSCNVVMKPSETKKVKGICPKCGKPLTIGVDYRVDELADRKLGFVPENSIPFKKLLPFQELISKVEETGIATKKAWDIYNSFIEKFDNEFNILLNVPIENISAINRKLGDMVALMRNNKLQVKPGYDGVYGEPIVMKERRITDFF